MDCHDPAYEPTAECQPTSSAPGSAEKLAILRGRMERGESLWHELDRVELSSLCTSRPSTIGEKRALRACGATLVLTSREMYEE